ncbi:MAG: phosphoribosyltransferase, partial [Gemmatimonadetes bacterium]|nr:phosphoribosyltransferase [Gemmatimonadota bacterium]
ETRLRAVSDGFVCLVVDPMFTGVGAYYEQFPQLTDEEVVRLLAATRAPPEG